MVWLNLSLIPAGRRGVISSFKWFLPVVVTRSGGGGGEGVGALWKQPTPCQDLQSFWLPFIHLDYLTLVQCVRGGGENGVLVLIQIKTCRKVPLQVNFLDDDILRCLLWVLSLYALPKLHGFRFPVPESIYSHLYQYFLALYFLGQRVFITWLIFYLIFSSAKRRQRKEPLQLNRARLQLPSCRISILFLHQPSFLKPLLIKIKTPKFTWILTGLS